MATPISKEALVEIKSLGCPPNDVKKALIITMMVLHDKNLNKMRYDLSVSIYVYKINWYKSPTYKKSVNGFLPYFKGCFF